MRSSISHPADDPGLEAELRELRRLLPGDFPIIVGGQAAASYQAVLGEIDAIWLTSEPSLRSALDRIRVSNEGGVAELTNSD